MSSNRGKPFLVVLSERYADGRYIVVSPSGGILDDANGRGFHSAQKARESWVWKTRSRAEVEQDRRALSIARAFLKANPRLEGYFDDAAYFSRLDHFSLSQTDVRNALSHFGLAIPDGCTERAIMIAAGC